jgi:hypothetical protein
MSNSATKFSKRDLVNIEHQKISLRYGLARTVVRTIGWIAAIYFGRDIVIALAGRETLVSLYVSFLSDIKVVVSFALAGFAGLWAIVERRLRYRKVEQLHGRIKDLESAIDPNRTSSHLTPKGKTNPKDKTS